MTATLEETRWVAATVWLYGAGEAGEGQRALASLIRNRALAAAAEPAFGDGSLEAACLSVFASNPRKGQRNPCPGEVLRAFAWAALVLAGEVEDATRGAVYFHHHLEAPGWARDFTPQALIGSHFFYGGPAIFCRRTN